MNKKYYQNQKNGFALIYTLLFITLLLTAASATWLTGLADLRLSQRSNYSVQASELAKSAIDDSWAKYKSLLTYPMPADITFPVNACAGSKVVRTTLNVNSIRTVDENVNLKPAPAISYTVNGVYDYQICNTYIVGIGYYNGSKINLKADIVHVDTPIMDNTQVPPVQVGIDHSKDYLTVYQTGPSQ